MKKTVLQRFQEKYEVDTAGCWVWTASKSPSGYGFFESQRAHRWSYCHFVGPIPTDLVLDHLCRNSLCVNPQHLEAVTQMRNARRGCKFVGADQRAETHCPQGHEYAEHIGWYKSGYRYCRRCASDRAILHHRETYVLKGRTGPKRTHCKRGHAFNESNTVIDGQGTRQCLTCGADRQSAKNDRRRAAYQPKGRITHCKHGHEFTSENTLTMKDGRRLCRTCRQQQRTDGAEARNANRRAAYNRNA